MTGLRSDEAVHMTSSCTNLCNQSDFDTIRHACQIVLLKMDQQRDNNATGSGKKYEEEISRDDAAWILANAFLILTMQTGFGMLEAGTVSSKNIANIMIKNVVDVSIGGIAYWAIGYGLSFGEDVYGGFISIGEFFVSTKEVGHMGTFYAKYIFQFSFATAATTIVSGAVAERIKLESYMIYSFLNVLVYCLPACWAWNPKGWLALMGFYDFAGACVVHMSGGASALVAAYMLGPRRGRFGEHQDEFGMSSPVTALTGTFMLWWAWLAFNCGSTFGIQDNLWKTAAKVAVVTINGSIGGSLIGLILSVGLTWRKGRYFDIPIIICAILGGLVGITAGCSVYTPGEAIFIGMVGGLIAVALCPVLEWAEIDDPVGAVPVHFGAAVWSTMCVGIFGYDDFPKEGEERMLGIVHGGGFRLLGVQTLGCLAISMWSMLTTWLAFLIMEKTIHIRMDSDEELVGADWVEHRVRSENFADKLQKALNVLPIQHSEVDEIVVKVLTDLISSPEAQATADGVIQNFGGGGGNIHRVRPVAKVHGNHRKSIHDVAMYKDYSSLNRSSRTNVHNDPSVRGNTQIETIEDFSTEDHHHPNDYESTDQIIPPQQNSLQSHTSGVSYTLQSNNFFINAEANNSNNTNTASRSGTPAAAGASGSRHSRRKNTAGSRSSGSRVGSTTTSNHRLGAAGRNRSINPSEEKY